MSSELPRRIFLTGFSFSGKSRVAPLVAAALGWRAVDLDDLIEEAAGNDIPSIFANEGEPGFRLRETEALRRACGETEVVVATGGGVVLAEENRRLMAENGLVVCLEARPETVYARLRQPDAGTDSERPLLRGADPLGRIRHLKALRQPLYALADVTVHTDDLSAELVAEEVVGARRRFAERLSYDGARLAGASSGGAPSLMRDVPVEEVGPICAVKTETATYPVYAGWGTAEKLGEKLREAGLNGDLYVITDSNVHRHYGGQVADALNDAGFAVHTHVVPAGEASKTLESASEVYDWLTEHRAERGQAIVALGGGVAGDLAGFVAATYLRGIPLVQAPTSLLAMVDASIGGKVGVNQREAKNLVGAFYQPLLVFADVSTLRTLPERELTSGWAEVIKHALIMDAGLLTLLEEQVDGLRALEPAITTQVVRRSMALKAQVVAEDEREVTGRRSVLNFGHTTGHALEAATGYGVLLHGEAVAWGMIAAAEIGRRLGLTPAELVERQKALLERFDLLRPLPKIAVDAVLAAMSLDKKVAGRSVRWVLLAGVGKPVLRSDVPLSSVREVVEEMVARQPSQRERERA
ncbi:MAG TPA: 3-dehydroquinate synthase [Dehalococcoidia bacterium]|nr:3-dehydroquinate synthase [Dehalococcoidia bacterium]